MSMIINPYNFGSSSSEFIMQVDTSKTGSASHTFILPTTGAGYDATIDWGDEWGDDNTEVITGAPGNVYHVYGSAGTYIIKITENVVGGFPRIYFNNTGDKAKVTDIIGWGTGRWSSMEKAFYGCTSLVSAMGVPDISNVTNMSYMFNGCTSLTNLDVSGWDTSNVTGMYYMFNGCTSLTNLDVSGWDTSNVTGMYYMFTNCSTLDVDVSGFDITALTDASGMMQGSGFSTANYDLLLPAWDAYGTSGITFHAGTAKYNAGDPATARANMVSRSWSITDGGAV